MGKQALPVAVRISKQLTQLLRHSGRKEGLHVRPDGFAPLHDVLAVKSVAKLKATEEIVRELVRTNDKQRFALLEASDGQVMIRANQGHSMEGIDMDELCGQPVSELREGEVCCHGTYERHLASILKQGLKAGGTQGQTFRKDVHFSVKPPGEAVVSGMRLNSQVAIYVDLARAARDGIRFYRSANDVILSAGINGSIPPEYIERVWDLQRKVQVYPPLSTGAEQDNTSDAAGAVVDELSPAGGTSDKLSRAGPQGDLDEYCHALLAFKAYGRIYDV